MANLLGHVPEGALPVRVVLKVPEVAFLEKVLEKWLQPLKKMDKILCRRNTAFVS